MSVYMMICNNCDSRPASHLCNECTLSDRYFCRECAAMHKKIKLYRNHKVAPINQEQMLSSPAAILENSSAHGPTIDSKNIFTSPMIDAPIQGECTPRSRLQADMHRDVPGVHNLFDDTSIGNQFSQILCSGLYLQINSLEKSLESIEIEDLLASVGISIDGGISFRGSLACIFIALAAHFVIKYVLGRRGIFALIGVGILVHRIVTKKRGSVFAEIAKLQKTTDDIKRSVIGSTRKQDIPAHRSGRATAEDEAYKFWHEKEQSKSTLRLRVRKYESRRASSGPAAH